MWYEVLSKVSFLFNFKLLYELTISLNFGNFLFLLQSKLYFDALFREHAVVTVTHGTQTDDELGILHVSTCIFV